MTEVPNYYLSGEQRMTKTQQLLYEGGLEVAANPWHVNNIHFYYRPKMRKAFGLANEGSEEPIEIARKHALVEHHLRQIYIAPLVPRLQDEIIWRIKNAMGERERGVGYIPPEVFDGLDRQFDHQDGRREKMYLALLTTSWLRVAAKDTFDKFICGKPKSLSDNFRSQTEILKAATRNYLNLAYTNRNLNYTGPDWKTYNPDILENPGKYQKSLTSDLSRWLGVLRVSDDIVQSFSGAVEGPARFVPDRLSDLHTACYDAGCPPEEWGPLAFQRLKMLAIESQTKTTQEGAVLKDPDRPNPYIVYQTPDGSWNAYFSDRHPYYLHLAKLYENKRDPYAGCQGARKGYTDIPKVRSAMEEVQEKLQFFAKGSPDVDFTKAESLAHLVTLGVVSFADRFRMQLNRQASSKNS